MIVLRTLGDVPVEPNPPPTPLDPFGLPSGYAVPSAPGLLLLIVLLTTSRLDVDEKIPPPFPPFPPGPSRNCPFSPLPALLLVIVELTTVNVPPVLKMPPPLPPFPPLPHGPTPVVSPGIPPRPALLPLIVLLVRL